METLYVTSLKALIHNYHLLKSDINQLTPSLLLDVHYGLYLNDQLSQLSVNWSNLGIFINLMTHCKSRHDLIIHCIQGLMDHDILHGNRHKFNILQKLTLSLTNKLKRCLKGKRSDYVYNWLSVAMMMGNLFKESGWPGEASRIYATIVNKINEDDVDCKCSSNGSIAKWKQLRFNVHVKLLSVQTLYCQIICAKYTIRQILDIIKESSDDDGQYNVVQAYIEMSQYYFITSNYDEAYKWSMNALTALNPSTPLFTTMDAFRQSSKSCVIKRKFKKAEFLIKEAFILAYKRIDFNPGNVEDCLSFLSSMQQLKLGELISDYGFFLLNVDRVNEAVKLYEMALDLRKKMLLVGNITESSSNLLLAKAYEDVAYASYVKEYSTGRFGKANSSIDQCLKILARLLPADHLLFSSAKRVKSLILEEIALDHHEKESHDEMLLQAEELHLDALRITKEAFGESNVQTAKHYGNLGRLYQSMNRFQDAEEMHLKAINIKKELLGPDDYEVALSLGHLASLYNYDLLMFEKAEELYLKSIKINLKLFGESYSGLEYDYRGLLRVYENLDDWGKHYDYLLIEHEWTHLRLDVNSKLANKSSFDFLDDSSEIKSIDKVHNIIHSDQLS